MSPVYTGGQGGTAIDVKKVIPPGVRLNSE